MKYLITLFTFISVTTVALKSQTSSVASSTPAGFAIKQYWKTENSVSNMLIETNIPYNQASYGTIVLRGTQFISGSNSTSNFSIQISWNAPFGVGYDDVASSYFTDGEIYPSQIQFIETNGFTSIYLQSINLSSVSFDIDIIAHKKDGVTFVNSWFQNWKFSSYGGWLPHPNSLYVPIEDANYSYYTSKKQYTEVNHSYSYFSSSSSSYSLNASSQKNSSNSFNINPGNNNSLSFWGNNISRGFEPYSITMSNTNQTYAGRVAGETNSDFNMYFRMCDQAARGFNFQNGPGNNVAGIDGYGNGRFIGSLFANQSIGVGVTTVPSGYKMIVDGVVGVRKLKVTQAANWADYVFNKTYKLLPLNKLEQYILQNKHLPNVPTTAEVTKNGYDLNEIDSKLLEKVEELTLYVIEQDKQIKELKKQLSKLQQKIK